MSEEIGWWGEGDLSHSDAKFLIIMTVIIIGFKGNGRRQPLTSHPRIEFYSSLMEIYYYKQI